MAKPHVFKCRKRVCYCNKSWIVANNRYALVVTHDWSEALRFALKISTPKEEERNLTHGK